jgi:putative transcriptional regulator
MRVEKLNMGKNHKELNNQLEELRKASHLTQLELAEKVEVSRKSINSIENGIYIPTTVLALKIAEALNCTIYDVFQLPIDKKV